MKNLLFPILFLSLVFSESSFAQVKTPTYTRTSFTQTRTVQTPSPVSRPTVSTRTVSAPTPVVRSAPAQSTTPKYTTLKPATNVYVAPKVVTQTTTSTRTVSTPTVTTVTPNSRSVAAPQVTQLAPSSRSVAKPAITVLNPVTAQSLRLTQTPTPVPSPSTTVPTVKKPSLLTAKPAVKPSEFKPTRVVTNTTTTETVTVPTPQVSAVPEPNKTITVTKSRTQTVAEDLKKYKEAQAKLAAGVTKPTVINPVATQQTEVSQPIHPSQPVKQSVNHFYQTTRQGSNWQQIAQTALIYDAINHTNYRRQYYRNEQGDTASVLLDENQLAAEQAQIARDAQFAAVQQQQQAQPQTQPAPQLPSPQVVEKDSGIGLGTIIFAFIVVLIIVLTYKLISKQMDKS